MPIFVIYFIIPFTSLLYNLYSFNKMKTLSPYPFTNFSPYNSRAQSVTTHKKRSFKHFSQQKTPQNQKADSNQQSDFVQRVSKKYLYFHESPNKNNQSPKQTLSFPYNALNLCYFEKNFIDIKQKKLQKRTHLNSNQQIRSFLNTRLKTQPAKSRQISPEKQIFIGRRVEQKRIHNEQNLKNKIFFSVEKYQLVKNNSITIKTTKQQKLPDVLKIKAKKAYFMGLYKGNQKQQQQSTIDVQKTPQTEKQEPQDEPNPFEMKYRSRTEDNISLIKSIREEIRANLKIRDKKRLNRYKKEEVFEPWQVDWDVEEVQDSKELNPYQKCF